jgi:predicted nucleotidyltransferase
VARLDPVIANRARRAIQVLAAEASVEAAYVFGSQVEASADDWSDIDIAAFVLGVEEWDIERRAIAAARTQRSAGDDIELHLFPAFMHTEAPPASFAAYVKRHGVRLTLSPPT